MNGRHIVVPPGVTVFLDNASECVRYCTLFVDANDLPADMSMFTSSHQPVSGSDGSNTAMSVDSDVSPIACAATVSSPLEPPPRAVSVSVNCIPIDESTSNIQYRPDTLHIVITVSDVGRRIVDEQLSSCQIPIHASRLIRRHFADFDPNNRLGNDWQTICIDEPFASDACDHGSATQSRFTLTVQCLLVCDPLSVQSNPDFGPLGIILYQCIRRYPSAAGITTDPMIMREEFGLVEVVNRHTITYGQKALQLILDRLRAVNVYWSPLARMTLFSDLSLDISVTSYGSRRRLVPPIPNEIPLRQLLGLPHHFGLPPAGDRAVPCVRELLLTAHTRIRYVACHPNSHTRANATLSSAAVDMSGLPLPICQRLASFAQLFGLVPVLGGSHSAAATPSTCLRLTEVRSSNPSEHTADRSDVLVTSIAPESTSYMSFGGDSSNPCYTTMLDTGTVFALLSFASLPVEPTPASQAVDVARPERLQLALNTLPRLCVYIPVVGSMNADRFTMMLRVRFFHLLNLSVTDGAAIEFVNAIFSAIHFTSCPTVLYLQRQRIDAAPRLIRINAVLMESGAVADALSFRKLVRNDCSIWSLAGFGRPEVYPGTEFVDWPSIRIHPTCRTVLVSPRASIGSGAGETGLRIDC